MTWIYSSFVWPVNWSAEPQTVAVRVVVWQCPRLSWAGLSTPGAVIVIFTQGLSSLNPSPFPDKCVVFSV